MMRKRIMMETSKGCLGNLEHHGDFDPDEDQNGTDLYKGLDEFYEKIIDKFTKILEERSELIETLREGMTNESESDADNNNKKNDDEEEPIENAKKQKEKEKRNDISKGTKEARSEHKYNEEDVKDNLNNEHEFEKLIRDNREVAFSMEVDENENEKEKQTENVKEQQAEKEMEKQAENEEKQDDIRKGTEEAGRETKNDGEEVHAEVDDPNEQMKDKEANKQKVYDGNANEKDKQDEHNLLTQDEFLNKEKSPEDMTPQTFSLGLTPEESEPTKKEKEKQVEKGEKGLSPLESEPKPKDKEEKPVKRAKRPSRFLVSPYLNKKTAIKEK
ncbi:hypothetical protein Tco_0140051 [Tanacetum coccineum]